jgi:hypothetical protein
VKEPSAAMCFLSVTVQGQGAKGPVGGHSLLGRTEVVLW